MEFFMSAAPSASVQSLAPAVTSVQIVPEFHLVFVLFPAQEDLFPADDRREIQQPGDMIGVKV